MPEASTLVRLRFGVFDVDLRAGELRKHGVRVRLQEQPFQVLAMLLERPGEVVTREELRSRLWSADTFVDFDHGVNKAINRIRDTIGDSATSPRFIETVARRGYRFIADVAVLEQTGTSVPDPPGADRPSAGAGPAAPEVVPARRGGHAWMVWSVAGLTVALASILAVVVGLRSSPPGAPIHSLAVLPLDNLAGDASQEYFADGMTDELITTLGQISALRVISRTSAMLYKHARKPLAQIARELDVDAVVEGAVFRSGSQVRITAELVDARTDRHMWSESFNGELRDALTLQHRVAQAIATEIRCTLNPRERARLRQNTVVDPDAYEAYLKGRYFWNKRTGDDLRKAASIQRRDCPRSDLCARVQRTGGHLLTHGRLGIWGACPDGGASAREGGSHEGAGDQRRARGSPHVARVSTGCVRLEPGVGRHRIPAGD